MHDFTIFTTEEEFHKQRGATVGSSDIPVLAGLYLKLGKSPLTLWQEKTGRADGFQGNEKTWWGHQHEINILYKYVLDTYGDETAERYRIDRLQGNTVTDAAIEGAYLGELYSNTHFVHPEYPWATAHPDLLDVANPDLPHIQEAKSTGFFAAARSEDSLKGYDPKDTSLGGVPLGVYLQVQWQLFCSGVDSAGVSALIDTSDYRAHGSHAPGAADPRTQEKILALAERFAWHVAKDTPPQPLTWADVCSLWPVAADNAAMYPVDYRFDDEHTLADMLGERERLASRVKKDNDRLDEIKAAVGILLGENRVLTTPDGTVLATRTSQQRQSLSVKDLGEYDPALVEQLRDKEVIKETEFSVLRYRKLK